MFQFIWDIIINGFAASYLIHYRIRRIVCNIFGMKIAKRGAIHAKCYVSSNKLSVGSGSYINRNCIIDNTNAWIDIGENVGIAFGVKLLTTNHDYGCGTKRTGQVEAKNIVIESGTWIGASAIICPGVSIGKGVVIGAGSVVTNDCIDHCVYAGVPARIIKKLN